MLILAENIKSFSFSEIFTNIFTEWYYYVALLLVFLVIAMIVLIKKPTKTIKLKDTYKITFIALLIALSVLANIFAFGSNLWKFSFLPFINFIGGYLFGPFIGFSVGFLGDLVGNIIAPQGVYNPIIGISSGLWGFIPGVIFAYSHDKKFLRVFISYFISYIVCSIFLTTVATYLMYLQGSTKYPTLISYVLYRLVPTFITSFLINGVLSTIIMPILDKVTSRLKT